ncbi:uncharacterized protein H6S33_004164 [Morchella sextelata]|uniref:uncharacterized protein n=1 Tax=Morchella sextelata TaxID=1174677 RepID=UPI001D040C5B|nr:uncharacterized protein H6S33_004164 [Morchella sextelata]KAH0605707.1 hypothetical protein H6S33_004164 [Morchella sextelata]
MNMQVAFFVVMGGFVADEAIPPTGVKWMEKRDAELAELWKLRGKVKRSLRFLTKADPNPTPQAPRPFRAIVTPTGFIKYMEKGLIHEGSFDKAAITDKGKASTIGKLLAGGQALWLVVASISRWRAELPLTLLEIHVLIHVVRTLLIYAFWWNKPLDAREPIRIRLGKDDNGGRLSGNRPPNVTLPSATSSTTDHGHNPTKIDHGQTSTVIVVSKISSIPAVPERNESSAEIGQAHSRDTEHYALYPKDLDEFALEPLQGNQGVLVDGNKTKTLL